MDTTKLHIPDSQCSDVLLHDAGPEKIRWIVEGQIYVNRDTWDIGLGSSPPPDIEMVFLDAEDGTFDMRTQPTPWLSINVSAPQHAVHIHLENGSEFTDEDIRQWAAGDLAGIDFVAGEESLVIEYLAQIIIAKVL